MERRLGPPNGEYSSVGWARFFSLLSSFKFFMFGQEVHDDGCSNTRHRAPPAFIALTEDCSNPIETTNRLGMMSYV